MRQPDAAGDLAHTTLFRYAGPLRDPAELLRRLAASELDIDIDVSELLVVRERVFPSLDYEILHRISLAPARRGSRSSPARSS
jgi:hypothetical protein